MKNIMQGGKNDATNRSVGLSDSQKVAQILQAIFVRSSQSFQVQSTMKRLMKNLMQRRKKDATNRSVLFL